MSNSKLYKGSLSTIILKLLRNEEKMYGYEIVQKVKELTDAKIQLTEGALYPTLHSLQKSGELDIEKQYMGKRVRKYYTLTEQGLNTAEKKVSEFAEFIETMKFLLDLEPRMNNA